MFNNSLKEDSFMTQTGRSSFLLSAVLALIVLAVVCLSGVALTQGRSAFSLSATVLIDPQGTAYFSNPDGAITAVRLDSGVQLWTTPKGKAYRPLTIVGKFLVAMQEGAGHKAGKHLGVAFLQLVDGGEHLVNWIELPSGAWASVKDGLRSSLRMGAAIGPGDRVTVAWASELQLEVRGIAPDDEDSANASVRKAQVEVHSGAAEFDLSGRVLPLSRVVASAQLLQPARQDLSEDQRLKGLPETQYISADGRHILVSELTGNDHVLNQYRWTIYSAGPAGTREPIGTIASPFPTAPFFVSDSTLIYQMRPFMVRDTSGKMVRSPLKLVAMELRSGGKLWEHQVLDTSYYGPFPQ
jgi:hypothetical protein